MRIVVDTNVVVSALLKPESVPARALDAIWKHAVVLYDRRILDEYRAVLARPKFREIPAERAAALLEAVATRGVDVGATPAWDGPMPDEDDRMFVEVALAGDADAIVTGNGADFAGVSRIALAVLPPAALLKQLGY